METIRRSQIHDTPLAKGPAHVDRANRFMGLNGPTAVREAQITLSLISPCL